MLHAIYAVESFLHGLLRRKCNYHIVFFDNHDTFFLPRGGPVSRGTKYLLTREILVRHLQVNLQNRQSSLQIRIFPSVNSESFTHYLANNGIYFLMCHDGASMGALSQKDLTYHRDDDKTAVGGGDLHTKGGFETAFADQVVSKIGFRYMIHEFIRLGYNVALINGLEFRDTKVRSPSGTVGYRLLP